MKNITRIAAAWGVHFFTAAGICLIFTALIAAVDNRFYDAFIFLVIAVFIDAVDGVLSRRAEVEKYAPGLDGVLLDNIIDYCGFVFVPAFIFCLAGLVPGPAGLILCFIILLSSLYQFTQKDAKTEDSFFKGFPSYWNIVVLYLYLYQPGNLISFSVIICFALMVFIPVKYIYPSRTVYLIKTTLSFSALWGGGVLFILLYPSRVIPPWFSVLSVLFFLYYGGVSIFLTIRKKAS